jgi:hypothetical protein
MRKFLSLLPFLFLFLYKIHSLPIKNSLVPATLTSFLAFQEGTATDESIAMGKTMKKNQDEFTIDGPDSAPTPPKFIKYQDPRIKKQIHPTKTTNTCPNGLQDGTYIFRSLSQENWSFCGVSGSSFHEFHFQIRDCECFARTLDKVCASAVHVGEPSLKSSASHSPATISPAISPTLVSTTIHCSNDNYDVSPTDTCLLITLSDQFGDGWTSGDGSSENIWFGYSFSFPSNDGDVTPSSAITYHSLTCHCPRKIGCISPSSFASAQDQLIKLAIYSNEEERHPAFFWEILYLVQVIQNGRLMDFYYGGYGTQMEFNYTHSTSILTLSSKTDGPAGNGDGVDVSRCRETVVDLLSELPLSSKGWSIVDINDKHEPYSARNPFCFHPQLPFPSSLSSPSHLSLPIPLADPPPFILDQDSWHSPHAEDIFSDVTASSRHLSGELQSIGIVSSLAGVALSNGATNGIGTNSKFSSPTGVTISADGVFALVSDQANQLIRQIILSTGFVSTLAGVAETPGSTDGIGTNSDFNGPIGISISPNGLLALVGEYYNPLIRQIILTTASVSTLAGVTGVSGDTNGIGTNSRFDCPYGISISPDGLFALVADRYNHLIRQIILTTASVSTLAGFAVSPGDTNGIGTNARFNNPIAVSISPNGLFALVADFTNHLIRPHHSLCVDLGWGHRSLW